MTRKARFVRAGGGAGAAVEAAVTTGHCWHEPVGEVLAEYLVHGRLDAVEGLHELGQVMRVLPQDVRKEYYSTFVSEKNGI